MISDTPKINLVVSLGYSSSWGANLSPTSLPYLPLHYLAMHVRGGFDSYGRPLEQIVNRARQEGIELENMKTDIKTKEDRALMNQKMEE